MRSGLRFAFLCAATALLCGPGATPSRATDPGKNRRIIRMTGVGFALELHVVDADGTNEGPFLTFKPPGISFNYPRSSPNGHRVAFLYYVTPTGAGDPVDSYLGIAPTDGSSFGTPGGVKAYGRPTWSPDGKKIAYLGGGGIWVVDVSTGVAKIVLANTQSVTYDEPSWSPDGDRIAVRVSEHVGPWGLEHDVGVFPATGGKVVNLTRPASTADYPGRDAGGMDWSPDGKKIVFHRGTEQRPGVKPGGEAGPLPSTIMLLDVATKAITELVPGPAGASFDYKDPVYSPDGTQIAGSKNGNLTILDATGTGERTVKDADNFAITGFYADWQPTPAGDAITMSLEPSKRDRFGVVTYEVASSGFGVSRASVELVDGNGEPLASESVSVRPNIRIDPRTTDNPRLLVCRADGTRLWPNREADQSIDYLTVPTLTTDAQGRAEFRVLAGTQGGKELLIETYETADEKTLAGKFQKLVGAVAGSVNAVTLLSGLSTQLNLATTRCLPSPVGTRAQKQDTLLEWLVTLRYLAASGDTVVGSGPLEFEFAPIHSASGHAAIVFYAGGSSPNPLLDYLADSGPPADAAAWVVLDTDELVGSSIDDHKPRLALEDQTGKLRTLARWQTDVGGPALKGRLAPYPDEDLTYFGWPYPPPAGVDAAYADRRLFDKCVPLPGLSAGVHSPVNLLFTDAGSNSLGVDAAGVLHFDLPGLIVMRKGKNPTGYVLPPGSYTTTMTGTGAGAATIVIDSPGASGATSSVYALKSKKGGTGTIAIDAAAGPAAHATFAGQAVSSQAGLALAVSGVPKKLKSGRRAKFGVVVRDPWKKPVVGAVVTARLAGVPVVVVTDKKGRAAVSVVVPHVASQIVGTVTVSAPGYLAAVRDASIN